MDFDMEHGKQLVDELVDLWVETKVRCERIEQLIKKIKETKK